ncbi:hypothetical protein K437DRAFT_249803 [Tilletiaria anomala UBC 951]|uniref:Nucleoporin Nup159/Nup146 N-terminal domain-containing protein n=1 Tax=Tilletiaria anomala (strain ATCC 24038 / CBS 436.72 / UBC 951) TaxID=1037660 RepID=A0A066VH68_TILAU|nr:uncharacterized protein K437DRAFT_249803 [Tilletiaria anomala UBC 951]KDN41082.1 hypothetical protein K437DRAFT_249803 [Tilletiaria anomala UBC 951]
MALEQVEAGEEELKNLILQQLQKNVNVRLSSPLDIPKNSACRLFSVSNSKSLCIAATSVGFLLHPLEGLRETFASGSNHSTPQLSPAVQVETISQPALGATPSFVGFADAGDRVLVGLRNGMIAIWETAKVLACDLTPAAVLQPPSPGLILLEIVANPSDRPELAVALYSEPGSSRAESGQPITLDVRTGVFGTGLAAPSRVTSICWSVKGKQLALGLVTGEIVQFTPAGEQKDTIVKPEGLSANFCVADLRWIENHVFLATYSSAASTDADLSEDDQVFVILRDASTKQIKFVHFPLDPAPIFGFAEGGPKQRRHCAWLKGWAEFKHLIFVGNVPSTDVGVIGSKNDAQPNEAGGWSNMELEETSRPTLPFSSVDKDADTSPVALGFDLTSSANVDDPNAAARGEDGKDKFPPMPVLYIYTNDGVLLAYHVIHGNGAAYPSMQQNLGVLNGTEAEMSTDPIATQQISGAMSGATPSPRPPTTTSPFSFDNATGTTPSTTPAFGTPSAFGSTPAFGSTSAFGSAPAFGQKSTFGPTSAFGQSSAFGRASPSVSTTESPKPSISFGSGGGFAGLANKPAMGFGALAQNAEGAGGSIFGSVGKLDAQQAPAAAFGSATKEGTSPSDSSNTKTTAFSFGGFANKGATAFGAPARSPASAAFSFGAKPAEPSSGSPVSASPPPPAFGQASAFGQARAFGQASAFGQKSAFGQPIVFGQSSPGASTNEAVEPSAGFSFGNVSGGGFGALAKGDTPAGGSIFGNGGAVQSKGTAAPVFGADAPTTSRFSFGGPVAAEAQTLQSMQPTRTAQPSDGFGMSDLGDMLGESEDGKEEAEARKKEEDRKTQEEEDARKKETELKRQEEDVKRSREEEEKKQEEERKHQMEEEQKKREREEAERKQKAEEEERVREEAERVEREKRELDAKAERERKEAERLKQEEAEECERAEAERQKRKEEEHVKEESERKAAAEVAARRKAEADAAEKEKTLDAEKEALQRSNAAGVDTDAAGRSPLAAPSLTFKPICPAPPQGAPFSFGTSPAFGAVTKPGSSPFPAFAPPASSASPTAKPPAEKPLSFNIKSQTPITFALPAENSAAAQKPFSFGTPSAAPTESPACNNKPGGSPFSFGQPVGQSKPAESADTGSKPSLFRLPSSGKPPSPFAPPAFGARSQEPVQQQGLPFGSSPISAKTMPAMFTGAAPSTPANHVGPSAVFNQPKSPQAAVSQQPPTSTPSSLAPASQPPRLTFNVKNSSTSEDDETGIQRQFGDVYRVIEQELQVLKGNMEKCAEYHAHVAPKSNTHKTLEDLSNQPWSLGDTSEVKLLALQLGKDISTIAQDGNEQQRRVAALRSLQLKAEAKREETARFVRARSDPEFARLVRIRQLGPEQAESQAQLRRKAQELHNRTTELEEYLTQLKSRINNEKNQRHAFRAPSLDSTTRSVRNLTTRATESMMKLNELAVAFKLAQVDTSPPKSSTPSALWRSSVDPFKMSNMANSLEANASERSGGAAAALRAHQSASRLASAFQQEIRTPLLTRLESDVASRRRDFQAGDLQMSFARMNGSISVGQRPASVASAQVSAVPMTIAKDQRQIIPTPPTNGITVLQSQIPALSMELLEDDAGFAPGARAESSSPRPRSSKASGKARSSNAVRIPEREVTPPGALPAAFFSFGPPPPVPQVGMFSSSGGVSPAPFASAFTGGASSTKPSASVFGNTTPPTQPASGSTLLSKLSDPSVSATSASSSAFSFGPLPPTTTPSGKAPFLFSTSASSLPATSAISAFGRTGALPTFNFAKPATSSPLSFGSSANRQAPTDNHGSDGDQADGDAIHQSDDDDYEEEEDDGGEDDEWEGGETEDEEDAGVEDEDEERVDENEDDDAEGSLTDFNEDDEGLETIHEEE